MFMTRYLRVVTLFAALTAIAAMACTAPSTGKTNIDSGPKMGGTLVVQTNDSPSDWDMRVNGQTNANAEGLRLAYNNLLGYKESGDLKALNYSDTTIAP